MTPTPVTQTVHLVVCPHGIFTIYGTGNIWEFVTDIIRNLATDYDIERFIIAGENYCWTKFVGYADELEWE